MSRRVGGAPTDDRHFFRSEHSPNEDDYPIVEVFLDSSYFEKPELSLVGAFVVQLDAADIEGAIALQYDELVEDSFYLDDARSFKKFRKGGFHAADDLPEIASRMFGLLARLPGAKILVEYSNHTASDLSAKQVLTLLVARLCETILRKFSWAGAVRFTFEQGDFTLSDAEKIIKSSAKRAHFKSSHKVRIGAKTQPHSLAVADYAVVAVGRMLQAPAADWQRRNWQAVRPLVSSVHCLDTGQNLNRANLGDL